MYGNIIVIGRLMFIYLSKNTGLISLLKVIGREVFRYEKFSISGTRRFVQVLYENHFSSSHPNFRAGNRNGLDE